MSLAQLRLWIPELLGYYTGACMDLIGGLSNSLYYLKGPIFLLFITEFKFVQGIGEDFSDKYEHISIIREVLDSSYHNLLISKMRRTLSAHIHSFTHKVFMRFAVIIRFNKCELRYEDNLCTNDINRNIHCYSLVNYVELTRH